MANYEATRYDFDGAYLTGIEGVNTGIVVPWGSASIPSGFLECNGQAVSQATYAALFAVIGTTYGNPGGGNFNVPDLTDRTVVNKSNTKSLAQTGGANTVTPTGNIAGSTGSTTLATTQIPSHTHNYNTATGAMCMGGPTPFQALAGGVASSTPMVGSWGNTGGGQSHDHTLSANFSGSANSVLQPYLVLVYIIKT
jgi:microcystin-dependent protein